MVSMFVSGKLGGKVYDWWSHFTLVGHDVYLVGGCVRDLILKQTPKDFDIITSADLKEVTFISYFISILIFKLLVCEHGSLLNNFVDQEISY